MAATRTWQTSWETPFAVEPPNKVALRRADDGELLDYYAREFGARRATAYDPFRMIIWEDAAERIISEFRRDSND